ncbi:MAG: phosphatase PAP2 family protein [Ignavibacteria bacterium]|nr:phosphatase PAP2 family protein [Ignavibacteria bacterium]
MIENFKNRLRYLEAPDVANLIFLAILSLISIFFLPVISEKFFIPIVNIFLAIGIVYCVSIYEKKDEFARREPGLARLIRFFYPVLMVAVCFKQIYVLMIYLSPKLYDSYLIKIDRAIFGGDPTNVSNYFNHPLLTEFLQIIYGIFYLMPIIFAMELYLWHRYEELKYEMFVVFVGFYLSFLGYLLVPAIGPRFTIHNFLDIDNELPGLFFAKYIRHLIDFGESIPSGHSNPELFAQRDAFPSGHTIMIVLITYLSKKMNSNTFYFYLPYSILMIFSTVYLRYHYAADLIGAIPFILVTILIANIVYKNKKINFKNISQ